jgi:hypothetical protein
VASFPNRVVCAPNEKTAEPVRYGFRIALYNSRAVYGFAVRKEERDPAEKDRPKADALIRKGLRAAGFPRMQTCAFRVAVLGEQ